MVPVCSMRLSSLVTTTLSPMMVGSPSTSSTCETSSPKVAVGEGLPSNLPSRSTSRMRSPIKENVRPSACVATSP